MGLIEKYDRAIVSLENEAAILSNRIKIEEATLDSWKRRLICLTESIESMKAPRDELAKLYPPEESSYTTSSVNHPKGDQR